MCFASIAFGYPQTHFRGIPRPLFCFPWRWWRWLRYTLAPYPKNTVIIVTIVTLWIFLCNHPSSGSAETTYQHSFSFFKFDRDDSDGGDDLSDISPIIWKHRHATTGKPLAKAACLFFVAFAPPTTAGKYAMLLLNPALLQIITPFPNKPCTVLFGL